MPHRGRTAPVWVQMRIELQNCRMHLHTCNARRRGRHAAAHALLACAARCHTHAHAYGHAQTRDTPATAAASASTSASYADDRSCQNDNTLLMRAAVARTIRSAAHHPCCASQPQRARHPAPQRQGSRLQHAASRHGDQTRHSAGSIRTHLALLVHHNDRSKRARRPCATARETGPQAWGATIAYPAPRCGRSQSSRAHPAAARMYHYGVPQLDPEANLADRRPPQALLRRRSPRVRISTA